MATGAETRTRFNSDRLFYSGMGVAIALVTVWGFAASFYLAYWLDPPPLFARLTPLLFVHGLIFSAWMAFLVMQPTLIATGRRKLHRKLGWAGAGIALAMFVVGHLAAAAALNGGFRDQVDPYRFYAVPFVGITSFAVLVALAIYWRNRAETHKRLILLANVGIIGAAIARIPVPALAMGEPFTFILLPHLITLAGLIYDWRSRGRPHRVWVWGGLAMLLVSLAVGPLMATDWWRAFAVSVGEAARALGLAYT